jgi:ribose transport system substrate-binding protein
MSQAKERGGTVRTNEVSESPSPRGRRKSVFAIGAVLASAILLAACGSSKKTSSTSGAATGSSSQASGAKYTIAVVPKSVGLFYWGTVHAGAEAAAKALHVNIIWKGTETETDVSGQVNILQDFITRKVSAIAFAASDAHGLVGTATSAKAAGIPVVNIDSGLSPQTPPLVATNNVAAAAKAADILAQQIGGKGDVALLPFVPSAETSIQRQQGFEQELKKYPNIHLVAVQYDQSDISTALSEMENILTAHPTLAGVFAANEPGVIGVVHALLERNLVGKVKVIGFDNAPDEVSALSAGQVSALIVQNPFKIGYLGVQEAYDLLQHKPVPHSVDTGAVVATKANMNQPAIHKLLVPPTVG